MENGKDLNGKRLKILIQHSLCIYQTRLVKNIGPYLEFHLEYAYDSSSHLEHHDGGRPEDVNETSDDGVVDEDGGPV